MKKHQEVISGPIALGTIVSVGCFVLYMLNPEYKGTMIGLVPIILSFSASFITSATLSFEILNNLFIKQRKELMPAALLSLFNVFIMFLDFIILFSSLTKLARQQA